MIPVGGVRGAGGGGKGGGEGASAPVEAPDSLRSIENAKVLDLISEGECEGPVNGAQSIFLDGTPLQNPDGTFNFPGVAVGWVTGTQGQGYLPGFSDVESETVVSTQVTVASPVTRTISNSNVNAARVTIGIPRLAIQNQTTADVNGVGVGIKIEVQADGGGYVEQTLPDGGIISGKTTTHYQRSYRIALTGDAPWDVRVTRLSEDSSSLVQRDTWWDSYTEIIDSKFTYPNSAVSGMALDASRFNNIPVRSFHWRGIKCQIPDNYDPLTRVYTGVWSGTFVTAWTDNPAWCFYDMLRNERYGLGAYVAAGQVDKYALYAIAQYCDELVDDGFGGQEPRYTCNLYLQTRAEAFKVIANMASIFRGMVYWGAGTIVPVADMPSDPVALFTPANVSGGAFTYAGTAKNTRHTVALVTWNDPDDSYAQKIEYVPHKDAIARFGVVETSIVAFGCTSRGQAHRMGKWLLYTEWLEVDNNSFNIGLDGSQVYPGAVIQTHDPKRTGVRFGGRLLAAAGTAVQLDAAVTLEADRTYALSAILPDGTLESVDVVTGPGTTDALTLAAPYSADPQRMAIWILAADNLVPQSWRVLALSEVDGKKGTELGVFALEHNPDKYDAIESDILLEPQQTSTLKARPAGVTNLMATEMLFEISAGVVTDRVTLSWSGTTGRYRVSYRGAVSNWVTLPETQSQTIEIDGLNPDVYTFNVVQMNALGIPSAVNPLVQEIYGELADPASATGFAAQSYAGQVKFVWDKTPDLDVAVGGKAFIRWSPLTAAATWNHGSLVNPDGYPGAATSAPGPLQTGTYMLKFQDAGGRFSALEASFVVTEALLSALSGITTLTESPAFGGTLTDLVVVDAGLQLGGETLWDSIPGLIDTWDLVDSIGGVAATGSYAFASKMDLGSIKIVRLFANIDSLGFNTGDTWDSRTDLIDDWGFVDGDVVEDADCELMVRITNDDPAGAPAWGPWHPLGFVADYNARAFDFRLDFESASVTHNRRVTTLAVSAKQ